MLARARSWDGGKAAIAFAMLAQAALTAWLALERYATFHNHTFDLALYARQAWGIAHGELWDPIIGGDFFGGHLAFVLVPLGLLGRVLGTVPVLLIAQACVVSAAAWPLYRLAAERLSTPLALALAMGWLLYPNLGHVPSYEFHPGTLAVLPLMVAACALARAEPRAITTVIVACTCALACRVSLALETCMFGLVAAFVLPNARRAGLALFLGSLLYFALWMFVLQPAHGAPLTAELHFGKWGGGPGGVVTTLFHDPGKVLAHFAAPARLSYPLRVLWPMLLLPLLAPRFLVPALPLLALNLLSEFPTSTEIYSHYLTPALPPLFVATLVSAEALQARRPWIATPLALSLLLAAASASVLGSGLPWATDFVAGDFKPDAATDAQRKLVARIGSAASVQAPDSLLAHLAERVTLHRAPPPERHTDFVALEVSHRRRFAQREDLLRTIEEPLARSWLARSDHQLVVAQADYLLFARGQPARGGVALRYFRPHTGSGPDVDIALSACLAVQRATLAPTSLSIELIARGGCPSDLALRLGSDPQPARVDLLFDGLLSPAQLRAGDRLWSSHLVTEREHAAIARAGLHLGVLRASGARPAPSDPIAVAVPLSIAGSAR